MVNNIINSSIRSLLNNRFFLFINLLGLTIGLTCFILILAFVIDEQKFDKHFHDAENIYRIYLNAKIAGSPLRTTSVPPALADALKDDFPEVEETLRMTGTTFDGNPELIKIDGHPFHESKILYADSNVISFFGLRVLSGGVELLNKPNNVIVTVACARRYFGTEAAIGRTIEVPRLGISFIVTGIVEELPPQSHFHFDMIASLLSIESVRAGRWLGGSVKTYAKISSTVKANELMARASPQIVRKYVAPQLQEFMGISFGKFIDDGGIYEFCAQPLAEIHLHSNLDKEWEPNSNSLYVQVAIFTLIGILLIAGVNYSNLSTSKSLARAKEIGVRKVLGSTRNQLMMQFLTEAVILTVMSLVFALLVSATVLPYFNQMVGKAFSISTILNVRLIGATTAVAVALGLISGLYPAVFMSAFDPIKVLKGDIPRGNGWRGVVKNVLVILQLTVTFAVLTFAVVVNLQLNFLKNKDLGFNKDQIIIVKNTNYLKQQSNSFIERLLKIPGIRAASYSSFIPGKNVSRPLHSSRKETPWEYVLCHQAPPLLPTCPIKQPHRRNPRRPLKKTPPTVTPHGPATNSGS